MTEGMREKENLFQQIKVEEFKEDIGENDRKRISRGERMKEEELKEWNIIDDFNKFILKWCKENYIGHLLDDDENDGEDFRDKLRKIQEGRTQTLSEIKKDYNLLLDIKEKIKINNLPLPTLKLNDRIEELRKLLSKLEDDEVKE